MMCSRIWGMFIGKILCQFLFELGPRWWGVGPVSRVMRMRICWGAEALGKTTAAAMMTLVAKANDGQERCEHRVGVWEGGSEGSSN